MSASGKRARTFNSAVHAAEQRRLQRREPKPGHDNLPLVAELQTDTHAHATHREAVSQPGNAAQRTNTSTHTEFVTFLAEDQNTVSRQSTPRQCDRSQNSRDGRKEEEEPRLRVLQALHEPVAPRVASAACATSPASQVDTHCSTLKCLFSTPAWFTLMRSIAITRSSAVRNHAFAGESGKKNLHAYVAYDESLSRSATRCRDAETQKRGAPEQHGDHKGDYPGDDHQPSTSHSVSVCEL